MPPPPAPIGAERLSQLTQKESCVFVIALNPSRLFLYLGDFVHRRGEERRGLHQEHPGLGRFSFFTLRFEGLIKW